MKVEGQRQDTESGTLKYTPSDLHEQEKRLSELQNKRASLLKNLLSVETSLYNLESSYLEETTFGNIIKGYDGFLNTRTPARRTTRTIDEDRLFSKSSVTYYKAAIDDDEVYFMPKYKKKYTEKYIDE